VFRASAPLGPLRRTAATIPDAASPRSIARVPDHVHQPAISSRRRTASGGPFSSRHAAYASDTYNIGRETFLLPVRWVDGWPVILSATRRCRTRWRDRSCRRARRSFRGRRFSVRDDFSDVRWRGTGRSCAPCMPCYDLSSMPGWLTIQARGDDISGRGSRRCRSASAAS
jgi:hypothetical protein